MEIVVTVMMSQLAYSPDGTAELNKFTLFCTYIGPPFFPAERHYNTVFTVPQSFAKENVLNILL